MCRGPQHLKTVATVLEYPQCLIVGSVGLTRCHNKIRDCVQKQNFKLHLGVLG